MGPCPSKPHLGETVSVSHFEYRETRNPYIGRNVIHLSYSETHSTKIMMTPHMVPKMWYLDIATITLLIGYTSPSSHNAVRYTPLLTIYTL